MGTGSFNPLCVQPRGAFYSPYAFPSYGNETKPSVGNFPAINSMNLGTMSFNTFGTSYVSDSIHDREDHEFGL